MTHAPHPKAGTRQAGFILTSAVPWRLNDRAPTGHFTPHWLMGSLGRRSCGIILLLARAAMARGVSVVGGLLMMILAIQMMAGRATPVDAAYRFV